MITKLIMALLVAWCIMQQCQIESLENCQDTTTDTIRHNGALVDDLLGAYENTSKDVDDILAFID
jgi:hypothetical protein